MKDDKARVDIIFLTKRVVALENEVNNTKLEVRQCPKCGHDTLQRKETESMRGYNSICLVCGSKILCMRTTKCIVVGDPGTTDHSKDK